MKLSHIVAMSENRVIGKDNKLPWRIPEDLKKFKSLTQHHTVIMGRKTYESIGKPLPNRRNIVVTKTLMQPVGVELQVASSMEDALAKINPEEECFVIGGESLYKQTLSLIDTIYLTLVHKTVDGDTFYPEVPDNFVEAAREDKKEFSFLTYKKTK